MPTCKKCGTVTSSNAPTCPACGEPFDKKFPFLVVVAAIAILVWLIGRLFLP